MARGYPMHWYLQFMYYAKNGLREISLDSIAPIKSVKLPVTEYKAFKIPCDWVDFVRVGVPNDQYFVEYSQVDNLIRHYKTDDQGNKIPWPDRAAEIENVASSIEDLSFTNYINDKGEHLGRIFNAYPHDRKVYMVMKERGEVQLDPSFGETEIYADYITDGVGVDACSAVTPNAYQTLQSYIFWQHKKHGRQYTPQERQLAEDEFYRDYGRLRSRIASGEFTKENIIKSLRRNTNATFKG